MTLRDLLAYSCCADLTIFSGCYQSRSTRCGVAPRAVRAASGAGSIELSGGFGLVIGVARAEDPGVLRRSDADLVVGELAELVLV